MLNRVNCWLTGRHALPAAMLLFAMGSVSSHIVLASGVVAVGGIQDARTEVKSFEFNLDNRHLFIASSLFGYKDFKINPGNSAAQFNLLCLPLS